MKTRWFLVFALTVSLIFSVTLSSFAGTKTVTESKDSITIDNVPAVTTQVSFPKADKNKNGIAASEEVWANISTNAGFDASYIFSQKIYAWGMTDVTVLFSDVYAKITNHVLFYKSGTLFNRADESTAGNDPTLETDTPPDYSPVKGTGYNLQCNHLVWDAAGTKKLDSWTYDSCTY